MRENIEYIMSYDELRHYAERFAEGRYNFIAVFGPPGCLKSSVFQGAVGDRAHVVSGRSSPFEVFCELQEAKDRLIILDDVHGLYEDPNGRRLLENVTEPRSPKRVHWTTDAPTHRHLLKVFDTASKVCIIDNNWGSASRLAALEDRGRLFYFQPTPSDIHEEMLGQGWFDDQEVLAYIGRRAADMQRLSVRTYVKAHEAKLAGEDWEGYIVRQSMHPHLALFLKVRFLPDGRKRWCALTGESEGKYDALHATTSTWCGADKAGGAGQD